MASRNQAERFLYSRRARPRPRAADQTRGGRQKHWIKIKNRQHPAMNRVMDFVLDNGAATPVLNRVMVRRV
jgi:hypothetical protein